MSYKDNENRYVDKFEIKFTEMANCLGISRQTISKYFNGLVDLDLIEYEPRTDRYRLSNLPPEDAALIPYETLRKLSNTMKQDTISVYAFLLKSWYRYKERSYKVSMSGIKKILGLGIQTGNNNYLVLDIMEVLQKLGLVKYELRYETANKCVYWITEVKNII